MVKFDYYTISGLNIKSSITFPELVTGKGNVDVIICSKLIDPFYNETNGENQLGFRKIVFSSDDILYLLDNKPLFRVRNGKEIIVNSDVRINTYIRSLILCTGIGTLLMQREYLLLHASAVEIDGKAIAFIGLSGAGKSTISLALNKKGYSLITDDVLSLEFDKNNKPLAYPSFPRIKLWDKVIEHIKDKPLSFQRIHPEVPKYSCNVEQCFCVDPLPLKMIFIIEADVESIVLSLNPKESLIKLIQNSYCINLFDDKLRALNLLQCSNLAQNVPIILLKRSNSLEKLEELIKIVENEILH